MCEKMIIKNLLAISAAYGAATGKSRTSVSKEMYGRGDFLDGLEGGERTVSISRLDRILSDFRERWPDGTAWPDVESVTMKQKPQILR